MKPRVLIASDHAGVELKEKLQRLLRELDWLDLGPPNDKRVDYPDFAEKLADKISRAEADRGVLICGSGIGMSIAANKVPGVRAAVVENPVSARVAREHNDANVLCLGARFIAPEYAAEMVRAWMEQVFSDDLRHLERIKKIQKLENKYRG